MYNLSEGSLLSPMSSPLTSPMKGRASARTTPTPPSEARRSDRHIANRDSQNLEMSSFMLQTKENANPSSGLRGFKASTGPEEPYSSLLAKSLFPDTDQDTVLGLSSAPGSHGDSPGAGLFGAEFTESSMNTYNSSLGVVYQANRTRNFTSPSFRVIPQTPERILDAPELIDDFYLNLVEWGSKNILTVALGQTVYLWNAENGDIQQLMSTDDRANVVTGVCWHSNGETLSVGTNDSQVQIWDTKTQKLIRTITGHTGRVGAMSWNNDVLASGSRDATIRLHDIRTPGHVSVHTNGHLQEVCGLRWSPNGQHLASGGNDNLLNIWDFRRDSVECQPLWQLRHHTAAVKALAWNPVISGLLVSGGGTADKTLRFWDVANGHCLQAVDTKSQVCGALWSHTGVELCTSHGYSDNQLTLWKYPSMKRIADLTGHSSRVLHLSQSPNGEIVVSAAGDETIRFWRCFGSTKRQRSKCDSELPTPTRSRLDGDDLR
jgi:cell division cycle protein 20 (cofactor of APC complex)